MEARVRPLVRSATVNQSRARADALWSVVAGSHLLAAAQSSRIACQSVAWEDQSLPKRRANQPDEVQLPRLSADLAVVAPEEVGRELKNISLSGARLAGRGGPLLVDGARITRCDLSESRFVRPSVGDAVLFDCNLANARWSEASVTRVSFENCQLTGLDVNSSVLTDVSFLRCKLSLSSFRYLARAKIRFADCELDGADFQGVDLRPATFARCVLTGALFHQARADGLDLRGSSITAVQGIDGLRGAVIDHLQLLDIVEGLAAHAGLLVRDSG